MNHHGALSPAFNMSLGFIPVVISILLCELTAQDTAIYIGTGIGIAGVCLNSWCKKQPMPNFILRIAAGMLSLLSLATLAPGDFVPAGALPLTLEAGILIPMSILYMHKRRFVGHFLKQTASHDKRLYAQGAEAAIVSARITLILGTLHFLIISIVIICQHPLNDASMLILYKVLPPVVFLASIVLNQFAIRFFNRLVSHMEYVPIVNLRGDIIGKKTVAEIADSKNTYIHPVIRIAVFTRQALFLCPRPSTALSEKGKTDIPMESYLYYGEPLEEGVARLTAQMFPQKKGMKPEFNIIYHFENEQTNQLVYLFITDIKDESDLPLQLKGCKPWTFGQIEENLGKSFFSSCFEDEYEHLKGVIYTREKYRES